jgi:hypothetical protein
MMYQVNDIEMVREHHHALLKEAESERLARRLRKERSRRGLLGPGASGGWRHSVELPSCGTGSASRYSGLRESWKELGRTR